MHMLPLLAFSRMDLCISLFVFTNRTQVAPAAIVQDLLAIDTQEKREHRFQNQGYRNQLEKKG